MKVLLFAFEGVGGSGKTSLVAGVTQHFKDSGHEVYQTREPGGSPLSEILRGRILKNPDMDVHERKEMFLLMGADHEKTLMGLTNDCLIFSDRYRGAFVAFHVYRLGIPIEKIEAEVKEKTPGFCPEITFLLDIDPQIGLMRKMGKDDLSHFDTDLEGARREAKGYLQLARKYNWVVLDALIPTKSLVETVASHITQYISSTSRAPA